MADSGDERAASGRLLGADSDRALRRAGCGALKRFLSLAGAAGRQGAAHRGEQ